MNTKVIRDRAEFEEGTATRTEKSDCFKHERKLTFRN
jgi:hypothetical protein